MLQVNQSQAEANCNRFGGHLAADTSLEEQVGLEACAACALNLVYITIIISRLVSCGHAMRRPEEPLC